MAAPVRVAIDEETIARLSREFRVTQNRVEELVASAPSFDRRTRTAILKELRTLLSTALGRAQEAIEAELQRQFTVGARQASDDLGAAGIVVPVAIGTAGAITLKLLQSEAKDVIAKATTNVSTNAKRVLESAARRAIQQQQLAGNISQREAARRAAPIVRQAIQDHRIFGIIDKRGAFWSLDRYTEGTLRTLAVQAYNTAIASKNLEAGIDLVKVPDRGSKHEACRRWEGKILSLTGSTPGFETVDYARSTGLWHFQCQHPYQTLSEDELRQYAPQR